MMNNTKGFNLEGIPWAEKYPQVVQATALLFGPCNLADPMMFKKIKEPRCICT